ncbi:kinase domain-containing [Cordyceps militaris]|uniref:Kinase domain-containing n=1 Tax=Cordyceps militaris TaxID=73501 RepID=A0A2H4SE01_CORMI|nr:kinase domain-containing [Cordyceps militaris]
MISLRILSQPWRNRTLFCRSGNNARIGALSLCKRLSSSARAAMASQEPPHEYRPEYRWIDGTEDIERYTIGGYHPVMIGDVFNERYQIVDKLGWGGYSTVWITRDLQRDTYVALKIGVAEPRGDETSVLKILSNPQPDMLVDPVTSSGWNAIPRLLDEFTIHGPNGEHPSYTTALAEANLKSVLARSMFRLEVARALSVKLVSAIAYMHGRGYIHGDIHLGNVMLRLTSHLDQLSVAQFYEKYKEPETESVSRLDGGPLPPNVPKKVVHPLYLGKTAVQLSLEETNLLLVDFGEAFAPKSITRPCEDCRSHLDARPPETYFEPSLPLSFSADIWCLGHTLWNIFSIRPLFGTIFYDFSAIIAQHVEVLGPLPDRWWSRWDERSKYFDDKGNSIQGKTGFAPLDETFDETVQKNRQEQELDLFSDEEKTAFVHLMRRLLSQDPQLRPSAAEVLKSDWVVNYAMKDFESPDASEAESESDWITLNISHRQATCDLQFPPDATVVQLFEELEATLNIPVANQKILVPKGPLLKVPLKNPDMALAELQGKTLKLLGSASSDVQAVQRMCERVERVEQVKQRRVGGFSQLFGGQSVKARPHKKQPPRADETQYTFLQVQPLQGLPRPERSLALLMRLKADPGIKATMKKRKYTVALLTEMEPLANTQSTHEGTSRILGLNRNKGEVIELRLRTDAHDGYRDYKTIRKTLCHELAHNIHSDHDRAFWDLCHTIEREVDAADWKTGGRTIGETSRYVVSGQEAYEEEEEDGGGWTGGEFVLGGVAVAAGGGDITAGLSRREVLAQAALERQRNETQEEAKAVEAAEKGWRPCQRQQPSDESQE